MIVRLPSFWSATCFVAFGRRVVAGSEAGVDYQRRMSETYLYLLSPETIAKTVEHIELFRQSRDEFERFIIKKWGDLRYSHAAFLADAAAEQAADWSVYHLSHALLNGWPGVERTSMDVELHRLFLDFEWSQPIESSSDEELGHLTALCRCPKECVGVSAAGYPIWIIAGWDNYEGHLTGAELAELPGLDDPEGFLSRFKRDATQEGPMIARIVDRLDAVRKRALDLGPDSLVIAVSSV
jgi:hypothetical protein